jgi:glycosyltransferase involved in cell wall biosynthesis
LLEAMACGLPIITTTATGGPDILDNASGRLFPTGNTEALIDILHWFNDHRDDLPKMSCAARLRAESFTWAQYRRYVSAAVGSLI